MNSILSISTCMGCTLVFIKNCHNDIKNQINKKSMSNVLAAFRKGQVNIFYKDGLSALQIPRTTIWNWITSDFKLTRQEGSGRPCKTSLRDKRQILRLAVSDPTICVKDIASSLDLNISRTTVGRILLKGGFKSFKRRYKIELSKPQKKKWLNWAMRRAIWREAAWKELYSQMEHR